MFMVHYLWVGHFDEEDGHVRFVRVDELYRGHERMVMRPLDTATIEAALRETDARLTLTTIPRDWHVDLEADGVLVGDEYTHNRQAIEFVARVAERTGADIWSTSGLVKLGSQQVVQAWLDQRDRVRRHLIGRGSPLPDWLSPER